MLAQIELAGDLVQRQGLGQIIPDIVQNGGHAQEILIADGFTCGSGVQGGGHADEQAQQGHGLENIAAESTVVLVSLQILEQLDQLGHFLVVQGGPAEVDLHELGEVGLGGGQVGEGFPADVQDIAGVEAVGHGAVEGALADEVEGTALQRIDLIVYENIARTGQRKHDLKVIVKMQSAHAPGLVLIQL